MLNLVLAGEDYEQDVRPLVKSFFPDKELNVIKTEYTGKTELDEYISVADNVTVTVFMQLLEDNYTICVCEGSTAVMEEQETVVFNNDGIYLPGTDAYASVKRRAYRNSLHRCIYRMLKNYTGKTLPWGTLTGIRPTKQVLERLFEGEAEEEIRSFMREEYYCSEDKLDLSFEVAVREKQILEDIDYRNGYSVYIGIPFCPTTCAYCSFTSYPLERFSDMVEPYIEALIKEIDYAAGCFEDKKLCTVYFGGGTPTTLSAAQLERVISHVKKRFDIRDLRELTVEAGRPDSITADKLKVLKEQGVHRISINPQTMRQRTLDIIGRRHTVEQIEEAFYLAREAGHDNINMDIIIGLSGETPEDTAYTLDRIGKLNPESLTVHTLAIKRAARLNTNKELYEGLEAQDVGGMLELTREFTKANGYKPYYLYRQKNMAENLENTGYAKPGLEGIYNVLIMEEKQTILALGAGGSSKFVFHDENRIERVENVKSLKDYIERTDEMIDRKKTFIADNF